MRIRLALLAVVGCGDPDYYLKISHPIEGAVITTDEVDMTVDGRKLGEDKTLVATLDDVDIPTFHSGFSGSCNYCFFTAGFDITAAMNGEHTVRLAVFDGDDEIASDEITLIFAVP